VDKSLAERKQAVEEIIEQLNTRRREAEKSYENIINNEKEKIKTELEYYRANRLTAINNSITQEASEKTELARKTYEETIALLDK
jgi:hypothetical protein